METFIQGVTFIGTDDNILSPAGGVASIWIIEGPSMTGFPIFVDDTDAQDQKIVNRLQKTIDLTLIDGKSRGGIEHPELETKTTSTRIMLGGRSVNGRRWAVASGRSKSGVKN